MRTLHTVDVLDPPGGADEWGCDQKPRTCSSACAMSPVGYQVGRANATNAATTGTNTIAARPAIGDLGTDVGEATGYRCCSGRSLLVIP